MYFACIVNDIDYTGAVVVVIVITVVAASAAMFARICAIILKSDDSIAAMCGCAVKMVLVNVKMFIVFV